ncbi:MAG: hypothetical protein HON53_21370 [Planctomycetaceae bacterium]|jgi:hypothetical protein|nr:hypothetical protein [Planctomycetaceae bacterium]MBT6155934.1 hypothetical protein [Planctomycetaceae bacterium]MBT6483151.1 hypothetical protein [Planctomycetaceae bacterium]MBT6497753.1 hypothetical protein [Planctomycetaceae bacterium]
MNLSIRHTVQTVAATLTSLFLAVVLFASAGCSRDDADVSANRPQGNQPPAASIRPAKGDNDLPVEDVPSQFEPPIEDRATADISENPLVDDGSPITPQTLDVNPLEPGHDALLAALEENGGDLEEALRAISVRIEHSSRGDIILLNLKGSYITDASLAKIRTLDSLLVLDIWDAPITDAGVSQLAEMTQLRALGIRDTQVTDNGLKHLSKLASLKELNLTLTDVTDAGMKHLTGLKSLHFLGLHDTAVTGTGINELQVALPLCKIAW